MAVTAFAKGIKNLDGEFLDGPVAATTTCYRHAIVMRDASGNLLNGATAPSCFGVGIAAYNDGQWQSSGTDPDKWDNASGSAAAFRVKYQNGIWGPFANSGTSIAAGMEGDVCYIVDNVTVHATSNSGARSPAGLIYRVDSTGVYVEFDEMKVRLALVVGAASGTTFTQTYSTANATVAAPTGVAVAVTLTDSTGYSGTHDDTLAASTVPTALTDNSGGVSGGNTIAAIADNAGSATTASTAAAVATLAAKVNAILTLLAVMAQNDSDVAQKVIELVTLGNALVADDLDNRQTGNALIDVLQAAGIAG